MRALTIIAASTIAVMAQDPHCWREIFGYDFPVLAVGSGPSVTTNNVIEREKLVLCLTTAGALSAVTADYRFSKPKPDSFRAFVHPGGTASTKGGSSVFTPWIGTSYASSGSFYESVSSGLLGINGIFRPRVPKTPFATIGTKTMFPLGSRRSITSGRNETTPAINTFSLADSQPRRLSPTSLPVIEVCQASMRTERPLAGLETIGESFVAVATPSLERLPTSSDLSPESPSPPISGSAGLRTEARNLISESESECLTAFRTTGRARFAALHAETLPALLELSI
jgi:hypothetical protein